MDIREKNAMICRCKSNTPGFVSDLCRAAESINLRLMYAMRFLPIPVTGGLPAKDRA